MRVSIHFFFHILLFTYSIQRYLGFSPHSSRQLLSITNKGFLHFWDVNDRKITPILTFNTKDPDSVLAWCPSNEFVFVTGFGSIIKFWDTRKHTKPVCSEDTKHDYIDQIAWEPQYKGHLITCDQETHIKKWNLSFFDQPSSRVVLNYSCVNFKYIKNTKYILTIPRVIHKKEISELNFHIPYNDEKFYFLLLIDLEVNKTYKLPIENNHSHPVDFIANMIDNDMISIMILLDGNTIIERSYSLVNVSAVAFTMDDGTKTERSLFNNDIYFTVEDGPFESNVLRSQTWEILEKKFSQPRCSRSPITSTKDSCITSYKIQCQKSYDKLDPSIKGVNEKNYISRETLATSEVEELHYTHLDAILRNQSKIPIDILYDNDILINIVNGLNHIKTLFVDCLTLSVVQSYISNTRVDLVISTLKDSRPIIQIVTEIFSNSNTRYAHKIVPLVTMSAEIIFKYSQIMNCRCVSCTQLRQRNDLNRSSSTETVVNCYKPNLIKLCKVIHEDTQSSSPVKNQPIDRSNFPTQILNRCTINFLNDGRLLVLVNKLSNNYNPFDKSYPLYYSTVIIYDDPIRASNFVGKNDVQLNDNFLNKFNHVVSGFCDKQNLDKFYPLISALIKNLKGIADNFEYFYKDLLNYYTKLLLKKNKKLIVDLLQTHPEYTIIMQTMKDSFNAFYSLNYYKKFNPQTMAILNKFFVCPKNEQNTLSTVSEITTPTDKSETIFTANLQVMFHESDKCASEFQNQRSVSNMRFFYCIICENVVDGGLFTFCYQCGHGGHYQHIEEWVCYCIESGMIPCCPICGDCYCFEPIYSSKTFWNNIEIKPNNTPQMMTKLKLSLYPRFNPDVFRCLVNDIKNHFNSLGVSSYNIIDHGCTADSVESLIIVILQNGAILSHFINEFSGEKYENYWIDIDIIGPLQLLDHNNISLDDLYYGRKSSTLAQSLYCPIFRFTETERPENFYYYSKLNKDLIELYRVNAVILSCRMVFDYGDLNRIVEQPYNLLSFIEQISDSKIYIQDIDLIEQNNCVTNNYFLIQNINVLAVVGGLNEVTFGCKMLIQLISASPEEFSFDHCFSENRMVSLKQLVFDKYTSRIIGKNGQNIKRVINGYGCRIMVSSNIADCEGAFREISYEGFVENVIRAFTDILVYTNYLQTQLSESHHPVPPIPKPSVHLTMGTLFPDQPLEYNHLYNYPEKIVIRETSDASQLSNEFNDNVATPNCDNSFDTFERNITTGEYNINEYYTSNIFDECTKNEKPTIALFLPPKFRLHSTLPPYTFTYGQYTVLIPFNSPESIIYTINYPEIPPTRIFHQKTRYKYNLFIAKRTHSIIFPHEKIYSTLIRKLCGVKINFVPVTYESISNLIKNYAFLNNNHSHILDKLTIFSDFDADDIKAYARTHGYGYAHLDNQEILGYNVEIVGDGKSVWICMYILFSLYRNNIDHMEKNCHIEMVIPGCTVGRIIGSCGKVVVSIQEQTNTLISIPKNRQGGLQASVIIAGLFIGIQAALCKIRHIIYTGFMDEFAYNDHTIRIQPIKHYYYGQDITNCFPIYRENYK